MTRPEHEGTTVTWTQYGKPAQDELRRVVAEAKQADLLAPVTLIVPNNLAGVAARRSLAQGLIPGGPAGVAALTVLTLDRLAELVAAPTLTTAGCRPLTSTVLAAAWRAELTADPGIFVEVAQHPATVTALVRAHRQLRELTADAIEAVGATGTLPAALIALHRRVVDRTSGRWYDVVDLRAMATGTLQTEQLSELGALVVHLPQELERSQITLLQKLATATLVRIIGGQTGNNHADAGILATAQAWGLALPGTKPRLPVAKEIHHASDSDDEVRGVVRQLVASLKEKPGHRMAVLYGNRVPYARLLHEHLSRAGIAFNGPGVRPTAERQVPRALLQLLALAEDDVDRAGLFALLAGAKILDAQGKPVPSSRWERMSRTAGIVTADDWEPRLARYSATERAKADAEDPSRQGIIERRRRDADAADALRVFAEELRTVLAQGRTTSTWTELSTWSLVVLHRYLGDEEEGWSRPEDQRAAEKVVSVLSSLTALNEVSDVADLETLRYVVELQLEEDLPRTGTFGTGVFVGPLSSAVGLELDEVYLVGLAEGITPGRLREDALLPEAARVAADGQLPALRARLDREHRHLMAALACAPTVIASFPRGDLRRGGERLPSRWLMPTFREWSQDGTLQATNWERASGPWLVGSPSFAASATSTPQPASEQEWRLRALSTPGTTVPADPVLDGARDLLTARRSSVFTRFDGNLSAHAGSLPDPADGVRVSSPTSLEGWVACPHAYFLQKILYVEPVEQPEELVTISPADRGTLMHGALDRFFSTGHQPEPDGRWSDQSRTALRELALEVAADFENRGLSGHPTMWAREQVLVLDDLDRLLTEDEQVRIGGNRRQVSSELAFGRAGTLGPVPVNLDDGRVVMLAGSADRVDECADGSLVVVDYKSGRADKFKGLSETDPDKSGSKLQLPIYGLAAQRELGDKAVRAEYWFIGTKDRGLRIGYELTDAVLTRYRSVLATVVDGIAQGVFPANAPEDQAWSSYSGCVYCDPDNLGAKERRLQWDRKKHASEIGPYLALTEPAEGSDG